MRFIHNNNVSDPRMNLALEEFCLQKLDVTDDYVLFYINTPSVIIGKHQNPFEECDLAYLQNKDIQLVRRISGGGTVYHDPGNLNFSFITGFENQKLDYFQQLIRPVLRALHRLEIPAELAEKNNIMLAGKKVSGNSQYTNINRMLSHGTLLVDSDLSALRAALKSNLEIMNSKAVRSVKSEVTNISDYMKQPVHMNVFRDKLMAELVTQFGEIDNYVLTDQDWNVITGLAEDKYKSWDWTFGRSPDFVIRHVISYGGDVIECLMQVQGGLIKTISNRDKNRESDAIEELRSRFIGRRYNEVQFQII